MSSDLVKKMSDYDLIEVSVVLTFDIPTLRKMKRVDLINTVQSEIDMAVSEVVKEIDGCLMREN